jgi:hypothetical protein
MGKKIQIKTNRDVNDEHEPLYCKHVYLANNINFSKAKMLIDYFYFITRLIRKSCSLTKQNKKKNNSRWLQSKQNDASKVSNVSLIYLPA